MKTVERIITPPPTHWVGDGFKVHGFFPNKELSGMRMSPFYLLDYNSKYEFPPSTTLLGVGPHPHRGFETVTIAYRGRIAHNDSTGSGGIIGEGDVQWMTAGSGIMHKEFHEKEFNRNGGLFHMVQLWVNLPAKDKMTTPKYQAITNAEIGKHQLPENAGIVEVIAGEFKGTEGPATTFSHVEMYNLKLKKGCNLNFELPANFTTSILMIEGSAKINGGEIAPENNLVVFNNDGETINIEAEEDAIILTISGEPIDEPISAYGPFLMNTREEIEQAITDFQAGKFGKLAG